MNHKAYLILLTDTTTGVAKELTIWSGPPWEQTLCFRDQIASVVYEVQGESYSKARDRLIEAVIHMHSAFPRFWEMIVRKGDRDFKEDWRRIAGGRFNPTDIGEIV